MTSAPVVLIVEDEQGFRSAVAMALADEGFEVATAGDGEAALELLDEIEPRAIVLDLNMPRLDGFGFAEAYRKREGRHAPIIVCTTRVLDRNVRALGASAMLSKPVDIDCLVDVVKTHAV